MIGYSSVVTLTWRKLKQNLLKVENPEQEVMIWNTSLELNS